MIAEHALMLVLAYLCGSIPFGWVLARLAGHGDLRAKGSGNIGATNVLRTAGKKLGALTLLLDGIKGVVPVVLAQQINPALVPWCGGLAFAGHLFPVWLGFKGGKGVATAIGVALAASPLTGLAVIATWLLVALVFRFSSLAALIGIGLMPVFAWGLGARTEILILFVLMAGAVILKHHANIKRLVSGKEPKIGK